jgi:hypothetical protein
MRKFVKILTYFIACAIIGYVCILLCAGLLLPPFLRQNLFCAEKSSGFTCERLKEAQLPGQKEILFLGSSRAYRGFDPRIFKEYNLTSFNLGSSNQTPVQSLLLVNRYLEQCQPKLVVFEVNPDIFSNDGVESAVDIISYLSPRWDLVRMALKINNIKVYNTLIYNILIKIFIKNSACPPPAFTYEKYVEGGFVEISSEIKSDFIKTSSYTCDLSDAQINAFASIIQKLSTANIPVLLVQSPVRRTTYEKCTTNNAFSALMSSYGKYIDFNTYTEFDQVHDFSDDQHLSQQGVLKFNSALLKEIQRLYPGE